MAYRPDMNSHQYEPARYRRTIQRSNTIASTLFVLLASLAIFKIVTSWDTITLILYLTGVIE